MVVWLRRLTMVRRAAPVPDDFTWRADLVAGLITAGVLLAVHRVEAARAGLGR